MPAHNSNRLTPLARALMMRNALRSKLPMTGLGLALTMAVATQVQAQQWTLNIPAQPLDKALQALAEQINVQVLYNPSDLQNLRSSALNGSYDLDQSISTLLAGTGINYQLMGNTLTLLPPVFGETLELSSVNISGKAPGSTTEGTGSYTTGSTSSSTRLNLSPRETPQSVTVLTRQQLDDQNIRNLTDALISTPGISANRINVGTDGFSSGFISRGTTINNFQIDGVPTFSLARHIENTDIYDRVEIVRGATGMMNSLGSPAATINLIRKRPTYETQYKLNIDAGNWDRYGTGVDVSGSLNDSQTIRGRMVTQYSDQGAWTDHYKQEKLTFYGIGEMDLNDSTLLTMGFSHLKQNTTAPMNPVSLRYTNGSTVDFKAEDSGTPSWTYYDHKMANVFLSVEHQFSADWSGKLELDHTQYDSNSLYFAWSSVLPQPNANSIFTSAQRYKPSTEENNLDVYVIGSFPLFDRTHELIIGGTLSQSDTLTRNYQAKYSGTNSFATNFFTRADTLPKPELIGRTGRSDISTSQVSAYISSRFNLSDTTKLLLGGRITDWKRDRDSVYFSSTNTEKAKNQETGLFVPYIGIIQDLNENFSLFASYTNIFNPHDDSVRDTSGTSLAPEEGNSYEAGIKASFKEGSINSSLSFYRSNLDNRALWVRTDVYEPLSGTKTEGIELELNGKITDQWNLSGGYSFNAIKNKDNARLMTFIPQHMVKVFTTYRLAGALENLTVGGGFNWQGNSHNDQSCCRPKKEGSYFTTSLMTSYKINENFTSSLNVENVFDREYLMGYNNWEGSYGAPRSFMTSLTYTY